MGDESLGRRIDARVGCHHALEAEEDVLRRERIAVVPLDTLPDREHVRCRIGLLDLVCKPWNRLVGDAPVDAGIAVVDVDQGLVPVILDEAVARGVLGCVRIDIAGAVGDNVA